MATKRDYYEVLDIAKTATADEVKKSYRKMAVKYHPDKNQGNKEAEDKFKEATEAYEILSDANKRGNYDRFGHQGVHSDFADAYGRRGGFNASDIEDVFGGGGGFDDIFSSLFGFGSSKRGASRRKGADIRYDITLSLEEAAAGKKMDIDISKRDVCDTCSGSGAAPGSKPTTCTTCGGAGQVRRTQGFFSMTTTCPACHGSGTIISSPCNSCHGEGTISKAKKISVNIPKGIDDGTQLRVSGEGEAIGGGTAGDLYLFIHVKEHPYFVREGANLIIEVGINIAQAALADVIHIKTLDGKIVKLKIPAGTISGQMFRIKDAGINNIGHGSSMGDLYVIAKIDTPKSLTSEEKKLYTELKKLSADNNTPTPKKPKRNNW